ncbi:MAG: BPSS1780 family membrane protein, partial [Azonexus sp.]
MNESTQFPVVKATFRGDSREVAPGDCFIWLRQGWAIFIGNLGVWIGSTAVLMTLFFAANLVPVFGQIVVVLLLPVFAGGIVSMCHHQQEGGQAEIADLFAGFQHNSGSLVIVGVIFAAGVFGLALLAFKILSG